MNPAAGLYAICFVLQDSSPPSSPVAKAPLFTRQSYDNISLYTRKIGNQFNIPLKKGNGFSEANFHFNLST